MSDIYQPREDSFLLSEFVKKEISALKPIKVLDMGSGSGIQAETAINSGIKPENLTIADINPLAVKFLEEKFPNSNVIFSDLFSEPLGKFDLILFNPPYLPENDFDVEFDTTGGKYGSEIINRFLADASRHLSEKGKILLLTSSITTQIDWQGYSRKLLGKKRVFFEELYVWELSHKGQARHK